mmetsp:Transcript_10349/g.15564  ORF Transcript_10349/g.15564 Transcript_10349/m.15564 type:complete len:231 (-) Transcript_10349:112-804(-)|eukprot:CAMPEP_0201525642 /NCGR_PEP_ID=MMETSP0161_2-20130828/28972_1 /ASSEMBLY_ACC=CAM_ASM_000251 /TAXON_ID=180227 /ORGANISM="Neoparamoeba aestuarina, Strain SoJaBio B1-5/56/2" /LENGTH=230 /DNA_ID=CAMNT_0047925663 /DNA_START=15 /DNA_END=707 /DNA_ORIENTATION=+
MKKRQSAQDLAGQDVEVVVDPLFDDLTNRGSPTKRDLDPLFDDMPSPSKKDDDDDSFFSSGSNPSNPNTYTFTWRGWYSHLFYENKYSTFALIIVTFLLLFGYFLNRDSPIHSSSMSFVTVFAVHYTIAVLVGLIAVIAYFHYRQKPAPESSIILACVLWSHYPDLLGMMSSIPHQPWMSVFFFHSAVEASYEHLWAIVLVIDLVLAFYYYSLIEESRVKTSTRSLVAML